MNARKRFYKFSIVIFKILLDFRKEYKLIQRKGFPIAQKRMEKIHEKRAKELYDTAVVLGGASVKMCQFFSSHPDIFPDIYIKTLSTLQDNVPAVEFTEIEKILAIEYNDYRSIFRKIDIIPLASASIAQVHRAVLNNGEKVVLKILKPGIEKIFDIDFAIFFFVFRLISNIKILKQRKDFMGFLSNLLEDFFKITGDELNFKREAYIASQFKQYFKRFSYAKVPHVFMEYCTEKIIVMEYICGNKIQDIELWNRRNNDPDLIARRMIELYVYQLLFSQLVHYDPHPGNILITENSNLVFLDFGMAGEITDQMRNGLWDIIEASVTKDFRKIIDILDSLGFIRKGFNKYSLQPFLEFFFNKILDSIRMERESILTYDFSPIRDDFISIIKMQAINLPPNWAYIGKTGATLFGVISKLNPEFKIYEETKKTAFHILKTHSDLLLNKLRERTHDFVKKDLFNIINLPGRLNTFMDNMENNYYSIKDSTDEIQSRIDGLKIFVIRTVFFTISLLSAGMSYCLYTGSCENKSFNFLITSIISLAVLLISFIRSFIKERTKSQQNYIAMNKRS